MVFQHAIAWIKTVTFANDKADVASCHKLYWTTSTE